MTTPFTGLMRPSPFGMRAGETQTVWFDMTKEVEPYSDTILSATVTMVDVDDGTVIALSNAPVITSPIVAQTFDGPVDGLKADRTYQVTCAFNAYPSANYFEPYLIVNVLP